MNNKKTSMKIFRAVLVIVIAGIFILPGSSNLAIIQRKETGQLLNNDGGIIYVDDDNTAGPWNGSLEFPYQFIQDGVDHAECGDTVYVFNGKYIENVVITVSLILVGESTEGTIIDGDNFGNVINIFAAGVSVSCFTITHCGGNPNNAGILIHSQCNIISENTIQYNDYFGVHILDVNNTIYHNNFIKNTYQAFDEVAGSTWDNGYPYGGNYWSDYTGIDENEDGIGEIPYPTGNYSSDHYPLVHSYGSIMNKNTSQKFLTIQAAIMDNTTLSGHHIFVKKGHYDEHVCINKSLHVQGENHVNTFLNGRGTGSVIIIHNDSVALTGFTIQSSGNGTRDAGIFINASNSNIYDNMILNNYQGTLLTSIAMDNVISRNMISQNRWTGLVLELGCNRNNIFENSIIYNFYAGIAVLGATGNYLFHNNLMNNPHNAYDDGTNVWDDGYPSGGNYWDDYDGVDDDEDGIGDTPYEIPDGINIDQYPLMATYTGEDTIPPKVTIRSPMNGFYIRNLRFFPWLFRKSTILIGPITVKVEASDAQSGIDRVEFVLDDSVTPEFVDNIPPYSWEWSKPSLIFHKHRIIVIAYDNKGNPNYDLIEVQRYL